MNLKRWVGALAAMALVTGMGACAADTTAGGGDDDRLAVTVAFYPLEFLTTRLAGDHAEVTSLTAPGTEPHDLELTPRQVGGLSSADLIVYERGIQPSVDTAVEQSGNPAAFDVTTVVPLQPYADGEEHEHQEGQHEEGEHEEGEHEEGADHDHGVTDPHIWLDPTNMITMAEGITEQLKAVDPDAAADFDANLATLRTELTGLDEEFATGLATCERREFVVSHAAFGYLANRYDLTQIAVRGLDAESEPSPARIAEVQNEIRTHQVTTIFYETLVSPAVAETIADDLGLETDVLDPVEGLTEQSRGTDYVEVMRANLTALRTANACR